MSYLVRIIQAKPNPAGKDTQNGRPRTEQLLGEWVDLQNTGTEALSFSVLNLADSTFDGQCAVQEKARIYWTGNGGTLQPGEILRVHAGSQRDAAQMRVEDRAGATHHAFTESDRFLLNNDCGDNLSVWWKTTGDEWHNADRTHYDPNPPEGKILKRVGDKLV